jgi:mRNA interferase RelE/StbE
MTDVEYTEKALDQLEKLDPQVADRVMNKVQEATEWTEHRLEPLMGYPYYKLRAGDYRAIVTWDRDAVSSASRPSVTDVTSTTGISLPEEVFRHHDRHVS